MSRDPADNGRSAVIARRARLAGAWAAAYALYRGYYAIGGTVGMPGVPVSVELWREINGVAAVALLVAAVVPIALARWMPASGARRSLVAVGWVVAVGCVMHALVNETTRLLDLAGLLSIDLPFFAAIDPRVADLQDLLFNEPWFLVEGLLWARLASAAIRSPVARARWVGSAAVAIAVLTVAGLLSALGITGRLIVG